MKANIDMIPDVYTLLAIVEILFPSSLLMTTAIRLSTSLNSEADSECGAGSQIGAGSWIRPSLSDVLYCSVNITSPRIILAYPDTRPMFCICEKNSSNWFNHHERLNWPWLCVITRIHYFSCCDVQWTCTITFASTNSRKYVECKNLSQQFISLFGHNRSLSIKIIWACHNIVKWTVLTSILDTWALERWLSSKVVDRIGIYQPKVAGGFVVFNIALVGIVILSNFYVIALGTLPQNIFFNDKSTLAQVMAWCHQQAITWAHIDPDLYHHMPSLGQKSLTHWGRVTHICVSKLSILGSDNGLSPGRRQTII